MLASICLDRAIRAAALTEVCCPCRPRNIVSRGLNWVGSALSLSISNKTRSQLQPPAHALCRTNCRLGHLRFRPYASVSRRHATTSCLPAPPLCRARNRHPKQECKHRQHPGVARSKSAKIPIKASFNDNVTNLVGAQQVHQDLFANSGRYARWSILCIDLDGVCRADLRILI